MQLVHHQFSELYYTVIDSIGELYGPINKPSELKIESLSKGQWIISHIP